MHKILVPVDFSPVTTQVIDIVTQFAQKFGSEIRVIHVAPPDPDFVGFEPGPDVVRHQVATALRNEHRQVQEIAESLRQHGFDAKALLVQGPTAETIITHAHHMEADLIVLGSHGHGALYRALLGSVSESVLRESLCPVLIVPSQPHGA